MGRGAPLDDGEDKSWDCGSIMQWLVRLWAVPFQVYGGAMALL